MSRAKVPTPPPSPSPLVSASTNDDSLAWAELYVAFASVFRRFDMEIWETRYVPP